MSLLHAEPLRYSILDPTGNITALVESEVSVAEQPSVATELMARHPQVEQVGFVRFCDHAGEEDLQGELRMAGGEFCGNASMSTAALYVLRAGMGIQESTTVRLRVSGSARPVEVRLDSAGPQTFSACIRMPEAQAIDAVGLEWDDLSASVPIVRMQGISHAVITSKSAFWWLIDDASAAEEAVRAWCHELGVDGLGLMFVEQGECSRMTPLVYVPGSNTVFWENSCASGSAAVGMYRAAAAKELVTLALQEPGGILEVSSDPVRGITMLRGSVRLVESFGV